MRYWPRGLGNAKCPFYITDSRLTISCEAPVETGAERVRLSFENDAEKNRYMRENCFLFEPKCKYCIFLMREKDK